MLFQKRLDCFCAFCKNPRRVYEAKFLSVLSILVLAGLSVLMTYIVWESLDARGILIFAVFLFIGELFSQIKWRQSMICVHCGFDLILYKKNPERAGEKIKDFIYMRSENPEFLLRPALKLPPRTGKYEKPNSPLAKNSSKDHKISLQV